MRRGRTIVTFVALHLGACATPPAVPARILAGVGDTVIVNNMRPVRFSVRVQDAAGRTLPDSGIRYTWVAGDTIAISASGIVGCARRADALVRASLESVSSLIVIRCRPVAAVRFPGALEIVLGDTTQLIPFTAYGPDNRPVELLTARVWVRDSDRVALDGIHIRGRTWGTTLLSITVGDHGATSGVRVYAPATSLDGLWQERKLIAIPLRLARGDMRRWTLPPGGWILSILPPQESTAGLKLRVEGARCETLLSFGPRRYGCVSNQPSVVTVYVPWVAGSTDTLNGTLAVKPNAETMTIQAGNALDHPGVTP